MKNRSKILLIIVSMMLGMSFAVVAANNDVAANQKELDKKIRKVMLDRHYIANTLKDATVEEMADYIINGITNVVKSDISDEEKMETITLGIADIVVLADKDTKTLMDLLAKRIEDPRWLQVTTAIIALSGNSGKDGIARSMIAQVGGPDSDMGKLINTAYNDPVKIIGQRLKVLVVRVVYPAKSLAGNRLAGGAKTLPLPPIRRPVEKYPGQ